MVNVKRIAIKNWKNFGKAEISFDDRLFIVGANASGKSNLMDVFRFLKDVANDGLLKSVEQRGGISKLRYLNARSNNYVEIIVHANELDEDKNIDWIYHLQFNSTGGTKSNTVNVSFEQIKQNNEVIVTRRYDDENEDRTSRQYTYLEQPAMNGRFRSLFEFFRNISYVNIIPQLIRDTNVFSSINKEDYYGKNLLETIAETAEKTRKSRINKINEILKMVIPQFSDLEFIKDARGRPHLQVRYEHFRPKGAYQHEDQFSDGTLRLIGLIWAILDGESLLLLEEPELYLNSEIVRQLPLFIATAQQKKSGRRQVIISSHSFDILNSDTVSSSEIAILLPEKEGTKIEIANTIDKVQKQIDAGYTPADAVMPIVMPEGIADGQLTQVSL